MRQYTHEDLTGQVFGYLTAIEHVGRGKWKCKCVCGKEKIVNKADLKRGNTKSCGCKIGEIRRKNGYAACKIDDLTGQRFGNLTVIELIPRKFNDPVKWICKCNCGNERICSSNDLKHEGVTKCKICTRDSLQKRYPRLVRIYGNMKQRCSNPLNNDYYRYGERGIKVCEEWENSFEAFANWAIDNGYRDDLTIDRINIDGDYEPSNCRWATLIEQANNTSKNVFITYNGETRTLAEWSRVTGINISTFQNRYRSGWSMEEIINTPPSCANRKHKRK